ncbi:right-handed parallel beta-helix repeat-containing protein [Myxococcota bacterium]
MRVALIFGVAVVLLAACGDSDSGDDGFCGDGERNGEEICDGEDLAGLTCIDLGHLGGDLGCASDCLGYDLTGCYDTLCGNGTVDEGEECDGDDLAGQTCATLGHLGGDLACAADCLEFDSTSCFDVQCEEGFQSDGAKCIPIFDDCPEPDEIPVLGGGCQPVGITSCATSFESDGEGGCNAILPANPCSYGFLAVLGYPDCQPLGNCGTGTWGAIPIDGTTVFVDNSYGGGGSNGSQAAPFVTIQEAYDIVVPGGQIAISAGEYEERLVIDRPVRLTGRCAELVMIRGEWWQGQPQTPVQIVAGGSGSTIRGITFTGDATGFTIDGAQGITVENSQVRATGGVGVSLANEAEAQLSRVKVENARVSGIEVLGSLLQVTECVVRDALPSLSGEFGRGISTHRSPGCVACGSLTLVNSLVTGNAEVGVFLEGVDTTIASSVIRDTLPDTSGGFGRGVNAQCHPVTGHCGSLSLVDSLVASNAEAGVFLEGVEATIAGSVVRDTLPNSSGEFGRGVNAQCSSEGSVCGDLDLTSSVVAGNLNVGVFTAGVPTTLTSTIVSDTGENIAGAFAAVQGQGVFAMCDAATGEYATLDIAVCLVESSYSAGVAVQAVSGSIRESMIHQVVPRVLDDAFGYGIQVEGSPGTGPTTFDVTTSVIQDATAAGILYSSAGGTVSGSQITGGAFTVAMNQDATPVVSDDNGLWGAMESEPIVTILEPSPAPDPLQQWE